MVCRVIIVIYIDRQTIIADLNLVIKWREAPSVVLLLYYVCRRDD